MRSAVLYLEHLLGNECLDESDKIRNHAQISHIANGALRPSCSAVLRCEEEIHYHAKLFYGSERPPLKIPVRGVYNEDPPRMSSRGVLCAASARQIQFNVAKTLFENYVSNILPKYPCFVKDDLAGQFNRYYGGEGSDVDIFVVSMVLAISSLTSKAHDFWKVASLSEALQRDAMKHQAFLSQTSVNSLQGLVLLIQMALLLPYSANLWYLSGEAMRMAITLGLHQESEENSSRQSIFWTVYQLERTVAIASGCPLAIADEHISTILPTASCPFIANVELCRLQSEIHSVQFFDRALESDYRTWTGQIEQRIQQWHDRWILDGSTASSVAHCRLLLRRPCPRHVDLPEDASTIAAQTIITCQDLILTGHLISVFQFVFSTFQAGMILLYALQNYGLDQECHKALETLPHLLDLLSLRWPAASDTAYYVRELRRTVTQGLDSEFNLNLLEELDFMVTQRRVHSVYHQNVDLTQLIRPYLDLSPRSPTLPLDETWQEIVNASFAFPLEESVAWSPQTVQSAEAPQAVQHSSNAHLDAILESVPACGFCRSQHIKCDRSLPACGVCERGNRGCMYFDVVLERDVPRSYVYGLYLRLKNLNAPRIIRNAGNVWVQMTHTQAEYFFGPPSCLSQLADTQLRLTAVPGRAQSPIRSSALVDFPPTEVVSSLLRIFFESVNRYYPVVREDDLLNFIDNEYGSHTRLILHLVIAITSQMQGSGLGHSPDAYFEQAMSLKQRKTDQLLLLQQHLLVCIYILQRPSAGDIWRNLGFAVRLFFDISHRPSKHDGVDEGLMSMLSRTLYSLESEVSLALGRPSLLVIGDKLRDDIFQPENDVSAYFYRISLMKMQIHSHILAGTQCDFWDELETWKRNVTREVVGQEVWANMHYYHTALLLHKLAPSASVDVPSSCDQLIRNVSVLVRSGVIVNWTTAHLLFSTGLSLVGWKDRSVNEGYDIAGILRRCLTALALLESDCDNLATGFSESLESLLE